MEKKTYKKSTYLSCFYSPGGPSRLNRDATFIACACGDEVKIVEIASGSVIRTFAGDSEPVTAIAISPDGKSIVSASRSTTTRHHSLETGACIRSWRPHKLPISDLAIDASGGYIATASADRSIKIFDLDQGFCTHNFASGGHSGVVLRVLFHPKQPLLFSAGDDSEVRVWDLKTKSCLANLKGHFSAVTSLALSIDGLRLISGGRDKVAIIWELRGFTKTTTIPVYESIEGLVTMPSPSSLPNAICFATAGDKGRVKVWRSDLGMCLYEEASSDDSSDLGQQAHLSGSLGSEYTDLMALPGGRGVMASTADARLLFLEHSETHSNHQLLLRKQLIGNIDEVTDLRFVGTREDPSLLAVATNSDTIRLFDIKSLSCSASLAGHKGIVLCMDSMTLPQREGEATTSSLIISGAKDHEIRLWSVDELSGGADASASCKCLGWGAGHVAAVSSVAFSKRGGKSSGSKLLFAVSAGADKLIKVWDVASCLAPNGVEDRPKKKSKTAVPSSKAQGPASILISAACIAHDKDINTITVSPNNALIASGSQDKTAKVWKMPDLIPLVTLKGHRRGVWSVEFSPVDQVLLTSSGDKTIRVWSLPDGACLRTFDGHQGTVLRALFVSLGSQIISCGADGLLKLWSNSTSERVNTFDEHEGKIWALASAGASESILATGGSDALVILWRDTTAEDARDEEEKEDRLAEQEQALSNALARKDFTGAAKLAFSLQHPGRLLSVLQRATSSSQLIPNASRDAPVSQLDQLLEALVGEMSSMDEIKVALEYCREWNAHGRNCHAAQALLGALMKQKSPSELSKVQGLSDLAEGLAAYTLRHVSRLNRLLQSTFVLDYTLDSMNVLPSIEEDGEDNNQESSEEDMLGAKIHASGDDMEDDFEPGEDEDEGSEDEEG